MRGLGCGDAGHFANVSDTSPQSGSCIRDEGRRALQRPRPRPFHLQTLPKGPSAPRGHGMSKQYELRQAVVCRCHRCSAHWTDRTGASAVQGRCKASVRGGEVGRRWGRGPRFRGNVSRYSRLLLWCTRVSPGRSCFSICPSPTLCRPAPSLGPTSRSHRSCVTSTCCIMPRPEISPRLG